MKRGSFFHSETTWVFGLEKEEKERKKKKKKKKKSSIYYDFDPYYDGKGSRAAPDEPLYILMIRHAKIYKVDGSNTDPEDVVCLEKFKIAGISVLGSWNGLVALYRHPGDFFLLNPSTGKENLVKVPIKECGSYIDRCSECLYGICHDSDNDEYKAVIFDVMGFGFHVVNFKHKSSKCKIERQLPNFRSYKGPTGRIGTVVKGVPYWICEACSGEVMLYFDLKTGELRMGPVLPKANAFCTLGSLDGKLVVSLAGCAGMEFWSLDEMSNGVLSWRLCYASTLRMDELSTLSWMRRQDEVLVCVANHVLMVYYVKEQKLRLLCRRVDKMLKEEFQYQVAAYIPSLVDPTQ